LELSLRLVISGLLGSFALLLAGCDRQSDPAPQPKAEQAAAAEPEQAGTLDISQRGTSTPTIAFEGPDGKPVKLSEFRGRPLLVNLWATWCGPCVAEMPTLDALSGREAERLQVIVVSQDNSREKVTAWWAKQSFKRLAPYLDARSDLGFAFATGMVPTTVLYDKDGKEVWRVLGGMNWDGPRANTLLAETLGAKG
jgi:thiol-disulfide isomerase/thioredoxin